jgi:hypothetical protein
VSVKTAEISTVETSAAKTFSGKITGIQVSPNSYFTALFLTTFVSGLLVYLEKDLAGIIIFCAGWMVFPFLRGQTAPLSTAKESRTPNFCQNSVQNSTIPNIV